MSSSGPWRAANLAVNAKRRVGNFGAHDMNYKAELRIATLDRFRSAHNHTAVQLPLIGMRGLAHLCLPVAGSGDEDFPAAPASRADLPVRTSEDHGHTKLSWTASVLVMTMRTPAGAD